MSGIVRELVTRLSFSVNTRQLTNFSRIIGGIRNSMNSFASRFRTFTTFASRSVLALTGLISSLTIVANLTSSVENNIANLSRISGIARGSLERLRIVFSRFGLSTEEFQSAFTQFSNGIAQARLGYGEFIKILNLTGISLRNASGDFKNVDELFVEFLGYLRQISDPALQDTLVKALFGNLDPVRFSNILRASKEDFASMVADSSKLVANLNTEDLQNISEFDKQWSDLKNNIWRVTEEFTVATLPFLNQALSYVNQLLSSIRQVGVYLNELSQSISGTADKAVNAVVDLANDIVRDPDNPEINRYQQVSGVLGQAVNAQLSFLKTFNPLNLADVVSRNAFGVPLLNSGSTSATVNVNIEMPNGTTQEQAAIIQQTGETVYTPIIQSIERQLRQMKTQNVTSSY